MSSKIIFGSDLIDVLENKYNMNKLSEVPTKYKNGVTIIDFIYGKEKDIDDLKYNKPYVEFSIDDETDGFISGTMYLNGVESVQFDDWYDLKYFVKNAKWTESKKFVRKSLKEGIDVKIVYADDTPSEYIDDVTHNDILDIIEESPEVYKIFDISGSKKKLVWSDEYGFERAYESKKSARKSMKEGINDELIATSSDGETTLYLSDERQANHGKDPHYEFKLGENGYFTRYVRCDDNRCENIVLDWIKEFDLDISKSEISKIIKLHESKKSMKKSLKESKDSDFFNGIAKEFHFSKDEKTRYKDKTYISAIAVLFDRINNAIKTYGRNSDEEYNALNDCWEVISSAKQNGFNVDYDEDRWNKIAGLPNYH